MREILIIEDSNIKVNEYDFSHTNYNNSYGNINGMGCSYVVSKKVYKNHGIIKIDDVLKKGDSFLCRIEDKLFDFKIFDYQKIYTFNKCLEICLVMNIKTIKEHEKAIRIGKSNGLYDEKANPIMNISEEFRTNLIDGNIDIEFKMFDRRNKIEDILND